MDIWVGCTTENYQKLAKAFHQFGMPLFDITAAKIFGCKRE